MTIISVRIGDGRGKGIDQVMVAAYGIFSGGLDSMLAAKVLQDQGVEVRLLTFTTPFFGPENAVKSGQAIGLPVRIMELTELHLEMMQHPKHGFGRFMNPCIDCHALMFQSAGRIMISEGGDLLFSGEVLGQRPKSQNRGALNIVARESGFAEYILRPLSARLLKPTVMEEQGLIDRRRLLGLSGRTRKPQIELAAAYGLTDYPSPAGGCLLTDPVFSRRLKELTGFEPRLKVKDVELLKWGRHFRLPGGSKLVVGRNKKENEALGRLAGPEDTVLKVQGIPGPILVLTADRPESADQAADLGLAASIAVSYSDAPVGEICQVSILARDMERIIMASGRPKKDFSDLMV